MKKQGSKPQFCLKRVLLSLVLITSTLIVPAQIRVSGTVTDSNREPLIGVNITVSGSKTGTISDFNGKYTIQVPDAKSVLMFSYVGYKTMLREAGSSGTVNVTLVEDAQLIDDVVIVAYGTQKKSHLTGAVSSLKTEKLDEVPVARVDQALQGKLAGVQIINANPEAGAAPLIRVRGMGSISAASDPLIVVDGFPVPDGLSMVSMSDIESIEVLKDAASAALYGSRAAGGVILVTTKSGNIKKPKYSFKMYSGIRSALRLPEMLSTDEYLNLLYDEASLRMQDPAINGIAAETMAFNRATDHERATYLLQKYFVDQPTDWLKEGLRDYGTSQSYTLSASGGDKNMKYFISGNYVGEEGIMKNSTYDKFTFRARTDIKLSNYVTLGVNVSPTFSRQERPGTDLTDYIRFPSWIPIRHNAATAALTRKTAGEYAQPADFNGISISGEGIGGEVWHLTGANPFSSSNQNPVSIRERTNIMTDEYKLQGNSYLTIDFSPQLQFKTSNGFYFSFREFNRKEQTSANKAGNPNMLTRQMNMRAELLSENTLTYKNQWGAHEVDGLLGFTAQKSFYRSNTIVGTNFPDEMVLSFNQASQLILDSPSVPGTTSYYYNNALASFLGRVNYAYQGKYLASVSMRADGSSLFASGRKWDYFPAVSLGWRPSEEGFLKDLEWLSNLKARASFGVTGNNAIPQYAYMNLINTNNYVLGSGNGNLVQGMASTNAALGNPDISWEQVEELNFGIDLGFFNSKINLSVENYNSNTVQLLLQQPAMYITGHQTYWNNIGRVNNNGWEFELTTTNVDSKNFSWKTSANLSTNKNTLINYGDKEREDHFGERNEVYRSIVGQPAIQYFGYKHDGVWTTFEEVAAAKAMKDANGNPFTYTRYAPVVGGLKVKNMNGDNKIDADDRVVLGDPFPDFTWGITNTFTWKNFDLSFLFQGVQGIQLINGNINYNEQLRFNKAYTNNRYVSPMFPGDGKTVYSTTTSGGDLMLTDYVIEDGSYASLRDFSLGYKVPADLVKKMKISDVRAYFSAQNMLYWMAKDYRGINPEARRTSSQYNSPLIDGYQRGAFPLNRTFTLGVDIVF
jgi:TonB-dependent starch-binding outer membrane protein SusC